MERAKFLNRIENSLRQTLLPETNLQHPGPFPGYTYPTDTPLTHLIESFTRELEALSGHVHQAASLEEIIPIILEILDTHQARSMIAWSEMEPPGLPAALKETGIAIEDSRLSQAADQRRTRLAQLDGIQVGLTGAQAALANTGSLVLVHGPGRGRLASLLPPVHIALLAADKLYPSLPAFLSDNPGLAAQSSNLVFIAGPSRTADIEMTLSIGVHGPKELHVIIISGKLSK